MSGAGGWTDRVALCFSKGTIQQFIDSFLCSVMYSAVDVSEVPVVLKYALDFLDAQAARNNVGPSGPPQATAQVTDPELVHAWKANAYVLRFWMQLLHNPGSLFDIAHQGWVDSSLVVVGQTLVDTFSHAELPLCKESPSSKLLFAKDIARFRPMATNMFSRIRQEPAVDEDKFFEYIRTLSQASRASCS